MLGTLFSPVEPALEIFVKSQNACGGLDGHPMTLDIEDDADDPATAASNATQEITNDHIVAFVGNIQVLTINAMVPVVNQYKVPIIGGDITNNQWFEDQYIFPEGPPSGAIAYGYIQAAKNYFHVSKIGEMYCIEVPQACSQIDSATQALAPKLGVTLAGNYRVSITVPSYTSQCEGLKNAGVQMVALTMDANSQVRISKSCTQVGYSPHYAAYPLGVGNQSLFLGNSALSNTYVPLNAFPWFENVTPAEQYYQKAVADIDPGFTTGNAASLGWTSGALLVQAALLIKGGDITSANLITALDTFKGQSFTTLGGLATAPLTFRAGGLPSAPYCLDAAVSNSNNSNWDIAKTVNTAVCTNITAPGGPA